MSAVALADPDALTGWISALGKMLELLQESNYGKVLFLIGVFLTVTGGVSAYKYMSAPPEDVTAERKAVVMVVLVAGIFFLVMGPSFAIVMSSQEAARRARQSPDSTLKLTSVDQRIENLRLNARVSFLIRLIVFDPSDEETLSVGKLTHLGKPDQRYTFVADYDELKGYSAADAARMIGVKVDDKQKISAIIFPVGERKIIPANGRGLLQVIDAIESDPGIQPRFDVRSRIGGAEYLNLGDRSSIESWSFQSYRKFYTTFCISSHQLRCALENKNQPIGAVKLIGEISDDWSPLGYAIKRHSDRMSCAERSPAICSVSDWNVIRNMIISSFGARVFLVENIPISTLNERMLIHFDAPEKQRIPMMWPNH